MESSTTVKLPQIENKEAINPEHGERFQAKNWKVLGKKEFQKLSPQEKSRYLAYEPPAKECNDAMSAAKKRLKDLKAKQKRLQKPTPSDEVEEMEKHTRLIGQLKAAEARNRIRLMRLRYQNNRASEVNHLISCQPTALKSVRLQSLVPPYAEKVFIRDVLGKNERSRVNALLEDETGLETARLLT